MNTGEIRNVKDYVKYADKIDCNRCGRPTLKWSIGIFIIRDIQIAVDKRKMEGFICLSCFGDRKPDEDYTH